MSMEIQAMAISPMEVVLNLLNLNKITEDIKDKAVEMMGMSACQARCLSCEHCSRQRCGNR